MKKSGAIVIALGMLLFVTLTASAGTMQQGALTAYFDLGVNGASHNTMKGLSNKNIDYDGTSGYLVGLKYDWGRFLAVAEYTGNTFDGATSGVSDYRSNTLSIRGGYCFIDRNKLKVDAILGYMKLDITNKDSNAKANDLTNGGMLVGLDGVYKFSDKFSLNGSYAVSVGADSSADALDNVNNTHSIPYSIQSATNQNPSVSKSSSLSAYRLKGIYQWTDYISIYLSYSFLESKLKYSYEVSGMYSGKENVDSSWHGWALGMNYKF